MAYGAARVRVTCDHPSGCRESVQIDLTETGGNRWDGREINEDLEAQGWTVISDSEVHCPNHSEEQAEEQEGQK